MKKCPKCLDGNLHEIYGEDDSQGLACLCGFYYWLNKPKFSEIELDDELVRIYKK